MIRWWNKHRENYDISPYSYAYIFVGTMRNFIMGAILLLAPTVFTSNAYNTFFEILPAQAWGVLLLLAGALSAVALMRHDTLLVRTGLMIGVVVLIFIAVSTSVAVLSGQALGGGFGPIVFFSLVIKDVILIMSPFVDLRHPPVAQSERPPRNVRR